MGGTGLRKRGYGGALQSCRTGQWQGRHAEVVVVVLLFLLVWSLLANLSPACAMVGGSVQVGWRMAPVRAGEAWGGAAERQPGGDTRSRRPRRSRRTWGCVWTHNVELCAAAAAPGGAAARRRWLAREEDTRAWRQAPSSGVSARPEHAAGGRCDCDCSSATPHTQCNTASAHRLLLAPPPPTRCRTNARQRLRPSARSSRSCAQPRRRVSRLGRMHRPR